ncbi:hypothetical protein NUACC21_45760 [Scytonema sp. NUACC21]
MNTPVPYLEIAQNYADGVRVLFAPSGKSTGERGARGSTSPQDLAEQAENLSPVSVALTQALAVQRADADPSVRFEASLRLLAKALTDLEISAYLLEAARDEEEGILRLQANLTERSSVNLTKIEENLQVLLGIVEVRLRFAERGETKPRDIPTARTDLSNTIADTLGSILERASETGELALSRVMGLGVAELAQAVGFIGMDIAKVLGQGDNVTRLYNVVRDFFNRAYESLLELLGQQLAQTSSQQVLEWIQELKEGTRLNTILEKFYQTEQTNRELTNFVSTSQADLEQFIQAIQGVNGLDTSYRKQISWVEKILQAFRWFGTLSTAVLPQGELLIASLCIILGTYVILLGADYVDSPKISALDCVPGVRRVVETNMATA